LFAVHGFAQGTPELLKEGQAAFLRGDLTTAQQHFESVYQIDPRNTVAIAYLRRIKLAQANKAAQTPSREKEFAAMILPKVAFRQVALGDVLEALRQQCARLYPEKAPVSFVLPEEKLASAQITLNLAQIPLTEALRYAAELAHATVTYEPYAVVIRPGSAGAPPAQPPGATPQQGAAPQ
jgi:tetratricopeptide (TPR) repeat protein